eukprot:m.805016 g.805016  ORF g.805016 m.805016 type:complete len:927 (-) comp23369_c0_seq18:132-2912(-)
MHAVSTGFVVSFNMDHRQHIALSLVSIVLLQCAFVVGGTQDTPSMKSDSIAVVWDKMLPRPSSITHLSSGTNFTPPCITCSPSPSPSPTHWWRWLHNYRLVGVNGSASCHHPGCISYELHKNITGVDAQVRACNASCAALENFACVGWSMIKVTPTSGQRGKTPLCEMFAADALATHQPFYVPDPNFECGTMSPLTPQPPTPTPTTSFPVSQPCISAVAVNGTAFRFCTCTDDISTTYSAVTATSAAFRTVLRSTSMNISVLLEGNVAIGDSPTPAAPQVEWTLTTATTPSFTLRALDLHFAFIGLDDADAGAQFYHTTQAKTWCLPKIGCQEWSGGANVVTPFTAPRDVPDTGSVADEVKTNGTTPWPPLPLPWAHTALLRPGRSSGTGGWQQNVGYAAWSNVLTLPLQAYVNDQTHGFGAGAARINVRLRCGSVFPATFRFGVFPDISGDSIVNSDDAIVFARNQFPVADWLYRSGLVLKLDSDVTSYISNEGISRISFTQTLDVVKGLSSMSDNQTTVLHLVGWQGSGHDTLYPGLDRINPNVGTTTQLRTLFAEALKYNVLISYHINTDEAYKNFSATQGYNFSVHPVPGTDDGQPNTDYHRGIISSMPDGSEVIWSGNAAKRSDPLLGDSYHISKTKDAALGLRWQRYERFVSAVPLAGTVHSDAYRDIDTSWENDTAGYIAEDEEATCGLLGDWRWFGGYAGGISIGCEGSNGMLSAVGPVPGTMHVLDYYWHGGQGPDLGTWNRIISGTAQGLDNDITVGKLDGTMGTQLLHAIYLKAKVLTMQMTDELLSHGRFRGGGDLVSQWPHPGGGMFTYRGNQGSVFIPALDAPPPVTATIHPGAIPKTTPTKLSATKAYVFSPKGGDHVWELPQSWSGKQVTAAVVEVPGVSPTPLPPGVSVLGSNLTLRNVPADTPIILAV